MAKTTFWDVIKKTIEKVGTPLSAKEIWTRQMNLERLGTFLHQENAVGNHSCLLLYGYK
jgi:hypothetical protein